MTVHDTPVLDLRRRAFKRTFGDIMLVGSWLLTDSPPSPCLVLVATAKWGQPDAHAYVVPLREAWIWGDDGDPRQAAVHSVHAATVLGLNATNRMTCMRIASIIRDHLDDLTYRIPPLDEAEKKVVAEFVHTDEDGREHYSEMRKHT